MDALMSSSWFVPVVVVILAAAGFYLWRSAPVDLPPPGNRKFTPSELQKYDGTSSDQPVYVAIKGTVFDVSARRSFYGPGQSYHALAGRDASKALGVNSLTEENCVSDISSLTPSQLKALDGWEAYYRRKYAIIGTVDQSEATALPFAGSRSSGPSADGTPPAIIGDKVFTLNELRAYNGADAKQPVYVAIKGIVYDVSVSRSTYAPGQSYNVFAGKDASKALGMSSLKLEDCHHDYSSLSPDHMKTLNQWSDFFKKKYPAVGTVKFT